MGPLIVQMLFLNTDTEDALTENIGNLFQYFTFRTKKIFLISDGFVYAKVLLAAKLYLHHIKGTPPPIFNKVSTG